MSVVLTASARRWACVQFVWRDQWSAVTATAVNKDGWSRTLAERLWVLDADLGAAFDRLSHDHLLASLGTFPSRWPVGRWLKIRRRPAGLVSLS
ncbi:unnamed protein product [[Actinomadura] parvosata subsp. kistnae]|nr:unnamed protein product [Actinomadura parvosata subsp. kistnae]